MFNAAIAAEPDLSKPWRDLDVATNKAETLLKIVPEQVVSWGRTANDMHLPYVSRLLSIRSWIDDYVRVCEAEVER